MRGVPGDVLSSGSGRYVDKSTTGKTAFDQMSRNPIVIGGVGGSGTRVVAELCSQSGVFLGPDLNRASDDLLYTYLFKHPGLPREIQSSNPDPEMIARLGLHERLVFGETPSSGRDWLRILKCGWRHAWGRYGCGWVMQRWNMAASGRRDPRSRRWGWKEPHALLCIRELACLYPESHFVLVMRNGLDMAFSSNNQQFMTWGHYFSVDTNDSSPRNRFRFWHRVNRFAVRVATDCLAGRCCIVRLEELFLDPMDSIPRLFGALDLALRLTEDMINIPRMPESHGRHRLHNTGWIDSSVVSELAELGYGPTGQPLAFPNVEI